MAIEVYLGKVPTNIENWIKGNAAPSELTTPLYFEGQEAGATVKMVAFNENTGTQDEHLQCHLECSTNGMQTWSIYDGELISLDNCTNNRAYFKAPEGQPNTNGFCINEITHMFNLNNKKTKTGGNIQFLLESTGTRIDVPPRAFSQMFDSCISLISAPKLPATILAEYCYHSMFMACLSLISAPELPATTLANDCYTNMFRDCESLTSINVNFTSWTGGVISPTSYWMANAGSQAAGEKTFTCPAALPNTIGDSNIPNGWTRVEK